MPNLQFARPASGFVVVLLLSLTFSGTAIAEDWELRLLGQWVTTSEDAFSNLDDGSGVYLGLERRLNDRWGLELGVGWNQLDGSESQSFDFFGFQFESRFETEVEWLPVSVAGNYHLTPQADFDLYVAGRVGWAFFRDVQFRSELSLFDLAFGSDLGLIIDSGPQTINFEAEDAFFYGLRLGFDRPFGDSSWALSATVDWTALELEYDPGAGLPRDPDGFPVTIASVGVDLDPVTVGFGVSKRW